MSEPASCAPVAELVKLRDELLAEDALGVAEQRMVVRSFQRIASDLDSLIARAVPCGDEQLRKLDTITEVQSKALGEKNVLLDRYEEALEHILTVNTDESPGPDVHYPVALTADEALGIIHILARTALSHARGIE